MLFELVGTGGPFSPGGATSAAIDRLIGEARLLEVTDPRRDDVLRQVVELASDTVSLAPIMTRANVYAYRPGCIQNLEAYLPGGADRFNDTRVGVRCH